MKLWDNFGVVGGYEVIAILDNIGQKKEEKKEQATNSPPIIKSGTFALLTSLPHNYTTMPKTVAYIKCPSHL